MLGYIVRRLLSAGLVVTLTSMIVFALFFLGPDNPAQPLCDINGKCTPERLALLTEQLGLNDTVYHQYWIWLQGLFVGREISFGPIYQCSAPCLGISYSTRNEVTAELLDKFPATLSLAIGGSLIYLLVGVFLGTMAARVRGTLADRGLVTMSLIVSSIPYYVLAILAWIYLSLEWQIFPDTTYHPLTDGIGAWAYGLLLPWLVLGLAQSTAYARYTRGQMVETLGEDYIRTATAKGVAKRKVIFQHALRAAIVPVITIFGLDFAFLLAGTVVTEEIFDIDGIGQWGIRALRAPVDFPVVAATVLIGAVIIVIANIIVDILYSFIDPRVRVS
ncbi:MAG: ABC transporter, permease protein 1 (cluster 5, nickel/peptides/opines) [uncultured Nocardioidaceae bacterium]|uniref:ABC transporter, permease protein 1 (Cluster 5, nickel/peptides/opines) n=1 Tax=uncultured Nocardioidaceae bacterium TaxID=253824 RepID=A0A6J4N908_9ACTN|nr:MAG: ABC transporter, permease protein 1 (cluster 5, nickel/peptides/opines) [uncultured Nocardioidaceae bacterium]